MTEVPRVLVLGRDPATRGHVVARLAAAGLAADASESAGEEAPPLAVVAADMPEAVCEQLKARWPETSILRLASGVQTPTAADETAASADAPDFVPFARLLLRLGVSERRRARSLSEFRRFSALIPQMSWITDPQGRALWFNERWYEFTGADPETVAREGSGKASYHPDDAEAARTSFLDAVARETSFEGEFRIRGRDGGYSWFLTRGAPMRDEHGTIVRWFGTHTDISKRRAAEEALRVTEATQRALVESLPQLVWTCTPNGACDYLSPQWSAYTGREHGELLGFGWADLALHPDDRAQFGDEWVRVLRGERGRQFSFDYRLRRHDGVWRWFSTRGSAIEGPGGKVVRWMGACTDIHDAVSDREALQQEARTRALELERLQALSDDLFGVTDLQGALLMVNPAWTRRLGWSEAELTGGMGVVDLLHPDDLEEGRAHMSALGHGQVESGYEGRLRGKDGSWTWIAWKAASEGGLVYGVGRDVSARRRAEEELEGAQAALRQAQKMEAIGQLTGGVAHDFNNLLTAITGNLELLQRRLARGRTDVDGFAEGALSGARRAAALTQRLLAFSRRQSLAPASVDVNTLVTGLEDLVRRSVGEGVRVVSALAPAPPAAWCDPNQLENALLNLVINARDAMFGSGVLRIETGEAIDPAGLPPGRYARVSVTDTGEGMTPEVAARAFDPFFTTKPIGQGTGLGLSQIYGFVTQSGGAAVIDGRPGLGAAVSLLLPHRADAPPAPANDAAPVEPEGGRGQAVLVVEDEAAVRALVVRTLGEAGYRVEEAVDAEAGLVRLEAPGAVDLLVTDIGLPGMNGRRLAEKARALRPGLKVLFVTGYEHDARPDAAAPPEPPGCDLLRKPFSLDALLARAAALVA